MSRGLRPSGAQWTAAAVVIVALAGLIHGGLGGAAPRTYALRAPNLYFVAKLAPGRELCEGPVTSPTPFRAVAIYGAAGGPSATLRLSARSPDGRQILASGATVAGSVPEEQQAQLNTPVAGGMPVRVCVTDERGGFAVGGSQTGNAPDAHVIMTGSKPRQQFSLLLLGGRRSLFSALPTAFSRAARFRPSWVGAWTFWMLGAGLLGGFALAVVAVARAVSADAQADEEA